MVDRGGSRGITGDQCASTEAIMGDHGKSWEIMGYHVGERREHHLDDREAHDRAVEHVPPIGPVVGAPAGIRGPLVIRPSGSIYI